MDSTSSSSSSKHQNRASWGGVPAANRWTLTPPQSPESWRGSTSSLWAQEPPRRPPGLSWINQQRENNARENDRESIPTRTAWNDSRESRNDARESRPLQPVWNDAHESARSPQNPAIPPSWDDKPPVDSSLYNPRDIPQPVVQAGWGAPPSHTKLQHKRSTPNLGWSSPPSIKQHNQQRPFNAWDTPIQEQIVKMDDLSSFSSQQQQQQQQQQRYEGHSGLRRTKSTASFADISNRSLRGRAFGDDRSISSSGNSSATRPFSRQIDHVNRLSCVDEGIHKPIAKRKLDIMNRIYVYGFPGWVRVRELIDIFCDYGSVLNVGIESDENPPYAYVDFERADSTSVAIRQLEDKMFFDMPFPLEIYNSKISAEDINMAVIPRTTSCPIASTLPLSEYSDPIAESTTIHLGNSEIEKLFAMFGPLKRVQIVNRPKENRTFAFIGYRESESARKAMAALRNSKSLYFNMSEPLKMEYSKIERKKLSEKPSFANLASSIDPFSPSFASFSASPASSKRALIFGAKNIIYVQAVPEDIDHAEFIASFSSFGQITLYFIKQRKTPAVIYQLDGSETALSSPILPGIGSFALIQFAHERDAVKVIDAKLFGAAYPRQRRVTISGGATAPETIKSMLYSFGEIVKISANPNIVGMKMKAEGAGEEFFDVEFLKAENALIALWAIVKGDVFGPGFCCEYSSSIRKDETPSERSCTPVLRRRGSAGSHDDSADGYDIAIEEIFLELVDGVGTHDIIEVAAANITSATSD